MINNGTVIIANGESLSSGTKIGGAAIVGVELPAAWTAANLTFQVSTDGSAYKDLYDSTGAEIVVTAAASRYVRLPAVDFFGFRYVKVRSGTSGTPVNQGAERSITLVTKEIER